MGKLLTIKAPSHERGECLSITKIGKQLRQQEPVLNVVDNRHPNPTLYIGSGGTLLRGPRGVTRTNVPAPSSLNAGEHRHIALI